MIHRASLTSGGVVRQFVVLGLLCGMALPMPACSRDKGVAETKPVGSSAPAATPAAEPVKYAADKDPLPSINATRAMQYTREVTAFGPRPIGSENHKKLEAYLHAQLKGDLVEDDFFTADTPEGKFPGRNIIAKYPGRKDGIIVIAGHYDTPYPLRNTSFVGANDGGTSAAILLELAHHLRGSQRDGYSVWLVFTDAEEAVKQWSPADSLYGTRHLAEKWEKDGTLAKLKAFLLADMIGDSDLNIERDQNSIPWLQDLVYEAASRYGYQSHFFAREIQVDDDHLPFVKKGVPSVDIIDLDYGYNNSFHHSTQDTMDKLSPRSLQIIGDTILESVRLLDDSPSLPPKGTSP
jgi:glutaminyl-peptide cyclotransferase